MLQALIQHATRKKARSTWLFLLVEPKLDLSQIAPINLPQLPKEYNSSGLAQMQHKSANCIAFLVLNSK
jgi:hypothetical protein